MNSWRADQLGDREKKNLLRSLTVRGEGVRYPLSGNDYLFHSRHEAVILGSIEASRQYGASSTGSPLVSGYTPIHQELESKISNWYDGRPTLVWNTGYAANHAVLSQFPRERDLVLADRLIHNSMITGILESGAVLKRYRHLDIGHLEELLVSFSSQYENVYVVTESLFSMDGDYPNLQKIAALKEKYPFFWILDEAHAVGWYGQTGSGLVEEQGVLDSVDLLVGTMGKGIGSMGAYTIFRDEVDRSYCINFSGEFIYSTYLAPSAVGASLASIDLIQKDQCRERYRQVSLDFRALLNSVPGLDVPNYDSPIIPIVIGAEEKTLHVMKSLRKNGIQVGAIRPPTVPKGTSRLRLSIHSQLVPEDIHFIADAIRQAMSSL